MVIPKHTGKPIGTPASLYVWSRRIRLQRHHGMTSVYRAVCYCLPYWAINKFYEVFSKGSAIVQSSFFSIPHTMWSSHLQSQPSIFLLAAAAFAKLFYFFPSLFSICWDWMKAAFLSILQQQNLVHIYSLVCHYFITTLKEDIRSPSYHNIKS